MTLEGEIASYDARIQTTQAQIGAEQGFSPSPQRDERIENLRTALSELRYAQIDLQSRLADARERLQALAPAPVDTAVVVDERRYYPMNHSLINSFSVLSWLRSLVCWQV